MHRLNKAFIDIRLRPGMATPPEEDRATATGDLRKNVVKIGQAIS